MKREIVCCEHNVCPNRPTWRLRRFENRPWYDPQCGRMWMTRLTSSYGAGTSWEWFVVIETTKELSQ